MDIQFKEFNQAKDRVNHLESNVITKQINNEYSSLWEDKKILNKKISIPLVNNNNSLSANRNHGNFNVVTNNFPSSSVLNDAYNKNF